MSDKPEAPEGWEAVKICSTEVNPSDWMRCHRDQWYKLVPQRWRAKHGGSYWWLYKTTKASASQTMDTRSEWDEEAYKSGNYFRTEEEAQEYADKINALLQERTQ